MISIIIALILCLFFSFLVSYFLIKEKNREIEKLESRITKRDKKIDNLITNHSKEVSNLNSEISSIGESHKKETNSFLDRLKAQEEDHKAKLAELNSEAAELRREIASLKFGKGTTPPPPEPPKPKDLTDEDKAKIEQRHNGGKEAVAIANVLGLNLQKVEEYISTLREPDKPDIEFDESKHFHKERLIHGQTQSIKEA